MTRVCDITTTLRADAREYLGALSTAQAQVDRAIRNAEIAGVVRLLEYIQWGLRTDGDWVESIAKPWPSDIELARKFLRRRITALQNLIAYWSPENCNSQRWKDSLGIKDVTTI